MECLVYRGVNLKEAMQVIREKRYTQAERRIFGDGIYAKAVFGPGLYLVSDMLVAAEYAFCHAQTSQDKGAILSQTLRVDNPIILNERFGEKELREQALQWKYPDGIEERSAIHGSFISQVEWTGNIIREYTLHHGYDSIMYDIRDDLIYYVAYNAEQQVTAVKLELVFDIKEMMAHK